MVTILCNLLQRFHSLCQRSVKTFSHHIWKSGGIFKQSVIGKQSSVFVSFCEAHLCLLLHCFPQLTKGQKKHFLILFLLMSKVLLLRAEDTPVSEKILGPEQKICRRQCCNESDVEQIHCNASNFVKKLLKNTNSSKFLLYQTYNVHLHLNFLLDRSRNKFMIYCLARF